MLQKQTKDDKIPESGMATDKAVDNKKEKNIETDHATNGNGDVEVMEQADQEEIYETEKETDDVITKHNNTTDCDTKSTMMINDTAEQTDVSVKGGRMEINKKDSDMDTDNDNSNGSKESRVDALKKLDMTWKYFQIALDMRTNKARWL